MAIEKYHESKNLTSVNSFVNSITDSRQYFSANFRSSNNESVTKKIDSSGNFSLTLTLESDADILFRHNGYDANILIFRIYNMPAGTYTVSFTVNGYDCSVAGGLDLSQIMLNKGQTALPYESYFIPYFSDEPCKKFSPLLAENPLCRIGEYKDVLDLSTGGVTRRIKTLVLTGDDTETYTSVYSGDNRFFAYTLGSRGMNVLISTHFTGANISSTSTDVGLRIVEGQDLRIRPENVRGMTVADFKVWLQQQYANGTPVTVWYVLETPETEIITVPSGLTGTIEGYLTQSGTPTPSAPIYPEANPALAWVPTSYRKFGTETDTITSLPAQIIGDGQAITSCQISGNTVQDGTPTPDAPVDIVGCGDIWNHWNGTLVRYHLGKVTGENKVGNLDNGAMFQIEAAPNVDYTVEQDSSPVTSLLRIYRSNNSLAEQSRIEYDSMVEWNGTGTPKATINSGSFKYIWVQFGSTWYDSYGASATISLVGDYVLPLTVNGREYPIYLGEVQTARRIGKIVLSGTEWWGIQEDREDDTTIYVYTVLLDKKTIVSNDNYVCSHFVYNVNAYGLNSGQGFQMVDRYGALRFRVNKTIADSTNAWKSYLAAQYAAGTPVTIWYVLAEPETAVVNEPLHKIGNYADTVAAENIPTTGAPENFDVLTTLKPSKVSLTYHGWHEHDDTKYTQGG